MSRPAIIMLAVLAISFSATPNAFSKSSNTAVQFQKGKQSKAFTSSIKGDDDANYTLQVGAGQVMQVLFSTTRGSCYMNVYEPGNADEAVFIGSSAGNEFGASPTKAGTYKIQVYQMRATARRGETCKYSISFEVTGGQPAAAPATAAGPSEVAKGACLYKIGVDADIVQVSPLKPGYSEIIMKARKGSRKVACTVSDDGAIEDWVEMR